MCKCAVISYGKEVFNANRVVCLDTQKYSLVLSSGAIFVRKCLHVITILHVT